MSRPSAEQYLEFLVTLADRTDPLALARFRARDLHVDRKPDRTLVTEADLAIERTTRDITAAKHPELAICGEEEGLAPDRGAGRLWIDPIDATANFVRGIPIFGTLLAVERDGEVIAGLVSAPALGTRWSAAKGLGAYRNGLRIRVSGVSELGLGQAFHGSLGGTEIPGGMPGQRELLMTTGRQRGFGDFYQHVLVAEGAGEIAIDPGVHPWDVAPLLVIAEEAGGRATSLSGERTLHGGCLVTTNGLLHDEVLRRLTDETAAIDR